MKTLHLAGALSCALALLACSTTSSVTTMGSGATVTIENTKVAQLVARAQTIAKTVCGFLPAAESLANIFAAGNGTVSTASQAASIACQALTAGVAYAAETGAHVPPSRSAQRGQIRTGTAVVNGVSVTVSGIVTDSTKAGRPR